jgi:2-(1,2-epoxy-1,2-dihydrophenyl)acetyl-CoA isomerase
VERETIRYEAKDGIGWLVLHRPERQNAMTNRMVREVHDLLAEVARDPEVRVLVLTGEGRGFCPGADLFHFSEPGARSDPAERLTAEPFRAAWWLHEMPQVTLAAINGPCAGAGFGWACACDLRVATARATFSTAFLAVAVAGDMGGPWTLPRLVGAAKARELYFLPERFGADEALRIGLVSRVFPDESFRDDVAALARRLADSAPLALRTMKSNFVEAERMSFGDYIALESERHMRISASPETAEAFRAFARRRQPG